MLSFLHVFCRSEFCQSGSQGISDYLFVRPQLRQMWLLALVCLLLCCQERTTVFVPSLDWWVIPCRDTTGCAIQLFLHCFGCLLGVPWCFVYAPVICQCKNLAGSILVQICQTFGIDIEEDDESGKPCGRPIVNWSGAELQFSSCITAVLFRSAHAVHRVSVRLTPYCMSSSISSLKWTLL